MRDLPNIKNDRMIVGYDTADDACVYQVSDDLVLINTVDFFPPMVDDPFTFGQIAAANALSDVWAMGGEPTMAMNLLCFPNCLPVEVAGEILAGGSDKAMEAGVTIAGGHTISDDEPKYGMCVTGFAKPSEVLANSAAKEGDLLVLTKEIGTGVLTTAIKGGEVGDEHIVARVIDNMRTLNSYAAHAARGLSAHACTDITGFGLAGHLCEMAEGAHLTMRLHAGSVPLLPRAIEMSNMGMHPQGTYRNRGYFMNRVQFDESVAQPLQDLMYDPQTSGGLVFALPELEANLLVDRLAGSGIRGAIVGEVCAFDGASVRVSR